MGPQRIYFSSSTNKGESWLPRVNLSYADPGVEHAFHAIAAGSNGDVRVAWMDARSAPYWNTYYRSSSNGGATWGEEIQLSGYVIGISLHREEGLPFPVRRLFRDGDRQPRRHARGLGRGIELPGAGVDLARHRAIAFPRVLAAQILVIVILSVAKDLYLPRPPRKSNVNAVSRSADRRLSRLTVRCGVRGNNGTTPQPGFRSRPDRSSWPFPPAPRWRRPA